MKRCVFNKIVVIQSLGEDEYRTGVKLHEDIELYIIINDRGLELDLIDVESKKDFVGVLKRLTVEAQNDGTVPIVHIESHGSDDEDGLVLSSGAFISWNELKNMAIELNVATKNNLLIVLAACHGASFAKKIVPSDRSPCWGLAGPTKAVSPGSILRSFSAFYQEILKSGSGAEAVKKLNEGCRSGEIEYYFTASEAFFLVAYKNYIAYLCNDAEYANRAKRMRKKIKRQGIRPLPSVGYLKRMLKGSQRHFFEKYRANFFMYDLYPENKERFTVEYEDVKYGLGRL